MLAERIAHTHELANLADSVHEILDRVPLDAAVNSLAHAIDELEDAA